MTETPNRIAAAMFVASGMEAMTAAELSAPVSEYTDPAPHPVEIVPGLFVGGTHTFDPDGAATPEVPSVDFAAFDVVVTLTEDARPVGEGEIRLPLHHGWQGPVEIMELNDLIEKIYPSWVSGESILIRSHFGVNRAPMVAALMLAKAGVEISIAVQLIRSVHTRFAFNDEGALSFLIRDIHHVIDPDWQIQEFAENLVEMDRMEQVLDSPDLSLEDLRTLREQMRLLGRPMSKGMGANQEMLGQLWGLMQRADARIANHD